MYSLISDVLINLFLTFCFGAVSIGRIQEKNEETPSLLLADVYWTFAAWVGLVVIFIHLAKRIPSALIPTYASGSIGLMVIILLCLLMFFYAGRGLGHGLLEKGKYKPLI